MPGTMPEPLWLYHFTHINNLPGIVRKGLKCDTQAHQVGRLRTEIGNVGIKRQRRTRKVPVEPGGVVADYVPFYFAPRSPMLYSIHKGNVPTYQAGQEEVIYLCTTLERISQMGLCWVGTDRNAARSTATFTGDPAMLRELVDWNLMRARMWSNIPEYPDRMERRQAELLVHGALPWEAVTFIGARTKETMSGPVDILGRVDTGHMPEIDVVPGWYF